jgi:hypothetical protein
MNVITAELREQAARHKATARAALQIRIDHGEEIGLGEAVELLDIRRSDELWKVSHLEARGRLGGPCEPFSDLPTAAWPHLRLLCDQLDYLAVTPEGKRIYEVLLRAADRDGVQSPASEIVDAGAAAASSDSEPPSPATQDRSAAFLEILDATAGSSLSIADYRRALARFGLGLSDKGRVAGVTISERGSISAAPGNNGISLVQALMFARLRQLPDRYAGFPSRQAIARDLLAWVAEAHPNVPGVCVTGSVDEERVDRLARDLGRRGMVEKAAGGLPTAFSGHLTVI